MRTNKGHGEEPKKRDALVDMGYETEDINMKGIGKGAAWFFGFATLSIVMVYPIILAMNRGFFQSSPSRAPLVRRLPAEGTPLLQSNMTVRLDTAELRQAEAQEMTTSGWVDKNKGFVHMPIDRAMDMYLKEGDATRMNNRGVGFGNTPTASQEMEGDELVFGSSLTVNKGPKPEGQKP